jgi:hypothetical protein
MPVEHQEIVQFYPNPHNKGETMNKISGFSQSKNMLKIDEIEGGAKDVWYWLTPKVQQFIEKFKVGQEVEYEVSEDKGKKTITFIKAKGEVIKVASSTSDDKPALSKPPTSTGEYTCADCGKPMKNNDYETCYTCSMARREKEKNSPEGIEKQKSIRSQAIGHMVSRSLISLQGSVDINNIKSIIDTLFEHYATNINKLENS